MEKKVRMEARWFLMVGTAKPLTTDKNVTYRTRVSLVGGQDWRW